MPEQSYRAFISYSHRDDAVARTLHKRLETYRLPKHLIGSETPRGPLPKQLTPIFRDLDELSAADDLSAEIKAALARSEVLIILASPAAKASKWVNLEIENFRALHGAARPVLVALVEGEPADAFPPALTATGHEPIAADFRKNAPGGKRLALLKLVAGITAAPLDALVQRDAQRQYRRVMAITGGALTAALVMALLLVVALRSQAEAQRQRQEAEGLVEYMLTDLRDKLKGVGRLDVMTAVNERAMKYYGAQRDLEKLPADSLLRRTRILKAMGQDDQALGKHDSAIVKFKEIHRATAALLNNNPASSNYIYAHASSENTIGLTYGNRQSFGLALEYHSRAKFLLQPLVGENNVKSEWLELYSHACGNICAILINMKKNYPRALDECDQSVRSTLRVLNRNSNDKDLRYNLIFQYIWLSEAYINNNNNNGAQKSQEYALYHVDKLIRSDPENMLWKEQQAEVFLNHGKFLYKLNRLRESHIYISKAKELMSILTKNDPSNKYWQELLEKSRIEVGEI